MPEVQPAPVTWTVVRGGRRSRAGVLCLPAIGGGQSSSLLTWQVKGEGTVPAPKRDERRRGEAGNGRWSVNVGADEAAHGERHTATAIPPRASRRRPERSSGRRGWRWAAGSGPRTPRRIAPRNCAPRPARTRAALPGRASLATLPLPWSAAAGLRSASRSWPSRRPSPPATGGGSSSVRRSAAPPANKTPDPAGYLEPSIRLASAVLSGSSAMKMTAKQVAITVEFTKAPAVRSCRTSQGTGTAACTASRRSRSARPSRAAPQRPGPQASMSASRRRATPPRNSRLPALRGSRGDSWCRHLHRRPRPLAPG